MEATARIIGRMGPLQHQGGQQQHGSQTQQLQQISFLSHMTKNTLEKTKNAV
jgi:hypothetical protein